MNSDFQLTKIEDNEPIHRSATDDTDYEGIATVTYTPSPVFDERDNEDEDDNDEPGKRSGKKSKAKRRNEDVEQPQTLEDLEALASGLLAR